MAISNNRLPLPPQPISLIHSRITSLRPLPARPLAIRARLPPAAVLPPGKARVRAKILEWYSYDPKSADLQNMTSTRNGQLMRLIRIQRRRINNYGHQKSPITFRVRHQMVLLDPFSFSIVTFDRQTKNCAAVLQGRPSGSREIIENFLPCCTLFLSLDHIKIESI